MSNPSMHSPTSDGTAFPVDEWAQRPTAGADAISFIALVTVLLRRRATILWSAVALSVIGIILTLIGGTRYTATSQFMPNQPQTVSRLSGLAAQFGFDLGEANGGESIDFYAKLVQSRGILKDAVLTEYRFPKTVGGTDTLSGNLLQLASNDQRVSRGALQSAIQTLSRSISVSTDAKAGTLTIRTSARWPILAEQINARLLALVSEFNLTKRHSRAAAERRFVEERLQVAQAGLDSAERAMRDFLEQNRTYQSSPRLQFVSSKLQRQVDMKQQLFTSLSQSYEQARIDEVRDTPVITIIDQPDGTAERHRGLAISAILGFMLGLIFGIGLALLREYASLQRAANTADYREFDRVRATVFRRLRPRTPQSHTR